MRELPSGTVTLLFTDVEGSTRLLDELGVEAYAAALAEHRRVLRAAFAAHGGVEVDTQGDAFFVVFVTAPSALAAAREVTERLASGPIRVRIGVHTGTPRVSEEGYVGVDVHRAARLAAAASGGQVVVSSSTRELASDGLHDLGEHRFKDLEAAERVYQLGEGTFPPLRSLPQTNLPVPATPFLGRAEELAAVSRLVLSEDVRLVTLTGAGGTGKTRLALQAAAEAADSFPGGVVWVPLASVADPSLVPATVMQALGGGEVSEPQLAAVFAERPGGEQTLVLLDNCEHLLPEVVAPIGAIRDLGGPTVLATSRERLQLQGEHIFSVPPLSEGDAAELFTARAAAVGAPPARGEEVRELCEHLDHLPLALELAAARAVVFTPRQLLARLDRRLDLLKGGRDVDARQQTLRATISWSHDLLTRDEQRLFRRLAVFSGGCAYAAAEAVCDADPELLQSLVDKSLVRRREADDEPRYGMLETIRQFALELFEASDQAAGIKRRHADYYFELSRDARTEADRTGDARRWSRLLEAEHPNLLTASDFYAASGDATSEIRLVGLLAEFWHLRGYSTDARRRLESVLARRHDRDLLRLEALNSLHRIVLRQHDLVAASAIGHERLALARELSDRSGVAWTLIGLATGSKLAGDFDAARRLLAEAESLFRALDETMGLVVVLNDAGDLALLEGDYAHAAEQFEAGLALHERVGRPGRTLRTNLAFALLLQGQLHEARPLFKQALGEAAEIGDIRAIANGLLGAAAFCATDRADPLVAALLIGASQSLLKEAAAAPERSYTMVRDDIEGAIGPQRGQTELARALEDGGHLDVDQAVDLALGQLG
jgi:predicted ATPase